MDTLLIGSSPPIIINTNPRRFRIANPAGFFFFTIAGRLQVPANAIPGTYEGEFTVTLEYE
jgi:spore coat protein U-like protein